MSTQSRTRELARQRQIRKRERDTERRAVRVEAEARRIEDEARRAAAIAEILAPAVMRTPLYSPTGAMLLGARVTIRDGKPVRSLPDQIAHDPLATHIRLTDRQARAAHMLRLDWADVGTGIGVGAVDYLRSGGPGDGQGSNRAIVEQIATRARLDGAFAAAGAFSPILARVVLDCIPVSIWARETGHTPEDAMTWLRGGLNRLVSYYHPETPERPSERVFPSFGPARDSYEVAEPITLNPSDR